MLRDEGELQRLAAKACCSQVKGKGCIDTGVELTDYLNMITISVGEDYTTGHVQPRSSVYRLVFLYSVHRTGV